MHEARRLGKGGVGESKNRGTDGQMELCTDKDNKLKEEAREESRRGEVMKTGGEEGEGVCLFNLEF